MTHTAYVLISCVMGEEHQVLEKIEACLICDEMMLAISCGESAGIFATKSYSP